jgi:hypothetical protein
LYEASVPNPEESSELVVDLYFETPGKQIGGGVVVGKAEVPQVFGPTIHVILQRSA